MARTCSFRDPEGIRCDIRTNGSTRCKVHRKPYDNSEYLRRKKAGQRCGGIKYGPRDQTLHEANIKRHIREYEAYLAGEMMQKMA